MLQLSRVLKGRIAKSLSTDAFDSGLRDARRFRVSEKQL